MKILVEVGRQNKMESVILQVAELAANTWANVTFLGLCPSPEAVNDTAENLDASRSIFLSGISDDVSLYAAHKAPYKLIKLENGTWDQQYEGSARKDLRFRIRYGNPGKAVVTEAGHANADIVVKGSRSHQHEPDETLKKVVSQAPCSVLIIREETKPQMIVCCLDQDTVSQSSMELINQLVSLYRAELEIVGITGAAGLSSEVDRRMASILSYYTDRNIKAWVRLVDAASLKTFVTQTEKDQLLALWMGRESLLDKIFSRQRIAGLAANAESSILILR
ncbi:hypothetical protein HNR65_003290 [Desulfosalsimonas propionicica]|uniref:UspA domain-containing protein n=1 Tax=Desulfosalsimonas propionicica TaxID=332175 RepID=A0A7W0HM20_9BACT|nr:universal stress protein [Desulfosalsimonas propionicica]MBA2882934.1 hypothetical protein [Desulfosalsimonas propionicica]